MSSLQSRFKRVIAFSMMSLSSVALSTDLDLALKVGGNISAGPKWQDEAGNVIQATTFDFSTYMPGPASQNVDSKINKIKIINVVASVEALLFALPTDCKIDAVVVDDAHVALLDGGTPRVAGEKVSFSNNVTKDLAMRFSSDGLYGDKTGKVTCTNDGVLRYTY